MLGWNSEDGWWFSPVMAVIILAIVAFQVWKRRVRRRSLREREDGGYVWVEWTCAERRSDTDPRAPGGAWDDGDGDGDGGD